VMQSWIFSIITPVFSVTWSFRNYFNMLMWCSRNISYLHFLEQQTEIFYNIINVFILTFDQCIQKEILMTPNYW